MIKPKRNGTKNTYSRSNAQQITNFFSPIKSGNNSEKHKNEIRQLLYSFKLTKTIYNNLINTIEKWEQSL